MIHDRMTPIGRVAVVFLVSVLIWRSIPLFFGGYNFAHNPLLHITSGILISVLAGTLVFIMIRLEKKKLGVSQSGILSTHLKNFAYGFLCWLIPVAIIVAVLTMTDHISVSLHASAFVLVPQIFTLFIAVFFYEAFPEEIIRSYILSNLEEPFGHWLALLLQTALFTLFAFLIGSLYSTEQILFIPGFGFLLGYFRVLSGNAFFSMGFHAAIMTGTQLLAPSRQLLTIDGNFFILRFISFILFPAVVGSVLLHVKASRTV